MQGPQGSVEVFMFSVERLLRNKGNYEYELARFIHIHLPVHEQISEGLTLFVFPSKAVQYTHTERRLRVWHRHELE